MDFEGEQKQEIEVLKSIYFEEFELTGTSPISFDIKLLPLSVQEEDSHVSLTLKIVFPSKYPEESPFSSIKSSLNIEEENLVKIEKIVNKIKNENKCSVCVFNICEEIKNFLVSINKAPQTDYEKMIERQNLKQNLIKINQNSKLDQNKKIDENAKINENSKIEAESKKLFDSMNFLPGAICDKANFKKWARSFYKKSDVEKMELKITGKRYFLKQKDKI
ncbi:hypothetical protein MHBO_000768 [Bonamia ostreae]|uniref:RWD domain-containing protein n=1 Tax=Bonamia ostreae TaxID=126728 RepID=A0ABV2AGR5_9EUKA